MLFGDSKRLGDLQRVDNKGRRFGAAEEYLYIRVEKENGEQVPLLFTDNQIKVAEQRAINNEEDLLEVGLLRDIFD